MSTTLREVLARRAEDAGSANLDIEQLVGLGEDRLRRRRLTVVLSGVAAAVVVIAVALGSALNGSVNRGNGPVDHPKRDDTRTQPVRKLVYSEGRLLVHEPGTIHFGDRTVETSDTFVHIDVTDDGLVYVTRWGRVWFSDGGRPEQIGSACGTYGRGQIPLPSTDMVVSGNAGSLVAWIDCPEAAELVVFDTGTVREVARQPMEPPCNSQETPNVGVCGVEAVIGEHVYVGRERLFMYDLTTGRTSAATTQSYADELLNHARGLVVGDTRQTGTATDGIGQVFHDVGSRLLAWKGLWSPDEQAPTKSFDTATGHALRLRLPAGYHADPNEDFTLFEWLDDDTVALVAQFGGNGAGDILTCQLSNGRCDVAFKRHEGADWAPLVPHLPLPG
jgi:hypothetical protein